MSHYEELQQEYSVLISEAEGFREIVHKELSLLLADAGITLGFPIQSRVKSWPSIEEKLERVPLHIRHIQDLQDLVGIRVVLLFRRDALKVGDLVSGHFRVVKQYDTGERLMEDQFGYSSVHYIVELHEGRFQTRELAMLSSLRAEIQLRTLAQHLWAAASHVLSYKQETDVPTPVNRAIHRVSALLEEVDVEFERVLTERDLYRSGIGFLESDELLNVDLVEKTLDALWPPANKLETEHYDFLLLSLNRHGITTQRQLTALIRKHRDDVLIRSAREAEHLRGVIETYGLENGKVTVTRGNKTTTHTGITSKLYECVMNGVFYGHVALTGTALQFETGERNPREPID